MLHIEVDRGALGFGHLAASQSVVATLAGKFPSLSGLDAGAMETTTIQNLEVKRNVFNDLDIPAHPLGGRKSCS